jgi:hypothetical protein
VKQLLVLRVRVSKMVDGSDVDDGCNIFGDCEMVSGKHM